MISVAGILLEVIGIEFLWTFFWKYLNENNFQIIEPGYATDADLLLVHSEKYINFVERFYKAKASGLSLPPAFRFLSGDNIPRLGAGKLNEAARLIVGSSKLAGEIVWEGKFCKAIALGGGGGSDPHFADELTQLGLTLEDFRMIGAKVRELAKLCDGRVVDLLCSGYNLKVCLWAGWLCFVG